MGHVFLQTSKGFVVPNLVALETSVHSQEICGARSLSRLLSVVFMVLMIPACRLGKALVLLVLTTVSNDEASCSTSFVAYVGT